MSRAAIVWAVAAGIIVTGSLAATSQGPPATSTPATTSAAPIAQAQAPSSPEVTGGRLHGAVKSGNIPLPGVTVTAQNTLTGKKFSTTSDITGSWSMTLPQNGRYVIRTQFAAFAAGSQEALLNATSHDQTVNFELMLASRAAVQEQQASDAANQQAARSVIQQLSGNGTENLSLMSALSSDTETAGGTAGVSGAELPQAAATPTSVLIR